MQRGQGSARDMSHDPTPVMEAALAVARRSDPGLLGLKTKLQAASFSCGDGAS